MPEKCGKHPDKDVLSFCHSCGKYYCSSCLEVGASFYYCYDEDCQAAKIRDERSISKELEESKKEDLPSGTDKKLFFKDSFYYLCIAFPLYVWAYFMIPEFHFHALGWLLLLSAATCVQIFVVTSLFGSIVISLFRFKAFKTVNRKERCRLISIAMFFVSFIVLFINMGKIYTSIIEENGLLLLSFLASIVAFGLYNLLITITIKGQQSN